MRRLTKIYDITLRDGTLGEGVSCSMEDAPVQIVALTSGPGGREVAVRLVSRGVSASRSSRPGEGVDRR